MGSNTKQHVPLMMRSCKEECLKPIRGKVTGKVPLWLEGHLLRNGPGMLEVGPDKYQHFFDGMALLHRFDIKLGGEVTYQNSFLKSNTYRRNMNARRIVVGEFGTAAHLDPCTTIFDRIRSYFSLSSSAGKITDNANINFLGIGDGIYVATETNFITRIDPETLETKERVDLNKLMAVNTATAHPHYASDGALLNIGSSFQSLTGPSYCIMQFPKDGDESLAHGSVLCRIPSSRALYPSYYHSFGLSENFVIFVEQPLALSIPKMAWQRVSGGSGTYAEALVWQPGQLTRFHVVRRSTGELLKHHFVASPFMVFHHANAYESEDGQQVVVDLCTYEDDRIIKAVYLDSLEKENELFVRLESKTRRFVLPLKEPTNEQVSSKTNLVNLPGTKATAIPKEDGTIFCEYENLTEGLVNFEMPQMNYKPYNGKKYKYLYGIARTRGQIEVQALAKVDVENRSHITWSSEGRIPSEPVFVERPGATQEDDGVLLCSLLDEGNANDVSLVVLDAKTMKEVARADFQCPSAIPNDLHGVFYKR